MKTPALHPARTSLIETAADAGIGKPRQKRDLVPRRLYQ
jgi:hypothetical protein